MQQSFQGYGTLRLGMVEVIPLLTHASLLRLQRATGTIQGTAQVPAGGFIQAKALCSSAAVLDRIPIWYSTKDCQTKAKVGDPWDYLSGAATSNGEWERIPGAVGSVILGERTYQLCDRNGVGAAGQA